MARRPENYYALPLGPAARYIGVRPETITKFRHNEMFQNHYQDQGFWFYPFQDLEILADQMRDYEKRAGNATNNAESSEIDELTNNPTVKVFFRDNSERTIDAREIDADRDWVWLKDGTGKISAVLNSNLVQAIVRIP